VSSPDDGDREQTVGRRPAGGRRRVDVDAQHDDERATADAPGRRVAVIGSGVAGLVAAWALRDSATVTLYEADDRLGGHAHTHDVEDPGGRLLAVDTGFIVHNRRTYPVLLRLFDELGVATQESEMSMSVSCEGCGLEYAGARRLPGLFPRVRNALTPRYLLMLVEVVRFHRRARRLLATTGGDGGPDDTTLAEFVRAGRFSTYVVDHFVAPLVACVWSTAPATAMRYPARYLFAFLAHHGMLGVGGSPRWRTVTGGSRSYVERVAKELHEVLLGTPVASVRRTAAGVEVVDADGDARTYDAVVVATHPHQALSLLAEPTAAESEVLGALPYSVNPTLLHSDTSLLPDAPRAAASWNYRMASCAGGADEVVVTYDMNRLQGLDAEGRYLVTLNGAERVDPSTVVDRMVYEHPVYTPASVAAQARLHELDDDRVVFAGAYHGWGFHEDGARSGRAAARRLGSTW
jgi:predicted NAD/FAD-binding protein